MAGILLTLSITTFAASTVFTDENTFEDWYKDAVINMYNKGIVTGYADGSFGANKNVNRAELVVMMDRLVKSLGENNVKTYTTSDSDITLYIKVGEEFKVQLNNPGDGGYSFDPITYNANGSKAIIQASYQDIGPTYHADNPEEPYYAGDFGKVIWTFRGYEPDETDLLITISRSWEENSKETAFKAHIVVSQ